MKIKVCGLKYPENMHAVVALKPDYIGMICYGKSPRYIDEASIAAAKNICGLKKTGVFVSETAEKINELVETLGLSAVQLHGDESPEFCRQFKGDVVVIKAFGVDEKFDFTQLKAYSDNVDLFLFDTKTKLHGGSGLAFNWALLDQYTLDVPFFVSGGISPDNLEEVLSIKHPQFYGVDLNSKFEIGPGLKDIQKLKQAFNTIKQYQSNEVRS